MVVVVMVVVVVVVMVVVAIVGVARGCGGYCRFRGCVLVCLCGCVFVWLCVFVVVVAVALLCVFVSLCGCAVVVVAASNVQQTSLKPDAPETRSQRLQEHTSRATNMPWKVRSYTRL